MTDPSIYTIGWICAITTEFVAARALLDERHDAPESVAQHDNNSYSLGRMGQHNVVIAALPKSEYGTTSAATVARDMIHSFPNIRVGLLVGIGGGAPSKKHDIRLGDIVVGTRDMNAGKGGVVQYDYGKTIQDRAFISTGSLNQAPQALLTAVSNLEAQYLMEGHGLNQVIEKAFEKWPRLRKTYSRPAASTDRLYLSSVTHPSSAYPTTCMQNCSADASNLLHREERAEDEDNPAIHYGLIASGNQLMKDANIRDRLAEERGVLCFEMEAAGLMNHFPCLVVRGVCDYSDTHKNKEWQGFASLAAAAYAKDLLAMVPPSKVVLERKITDAIDSLVRHQAAQVHVMNETKSALLEMRNKDQIDKVQRWLSPPDASSIANRARSIRQKGTSNWIFTANTATQEWISGLRQHIWLHGLPGCGKTVLSASILDRLEQIAGGTTLQFFFDTRDVRKQSVDDMLRSLIFQMSVLRRGTASLNELFRHHRNGTCQPTTATLCDCFQLMIKATGRVFILLDALDECTSRAELVAWITTFLSNSSTGQAKLILLSRQEVEFNQSFPEYIGQEGCVPLDEKLINSDISTYVRARLRLSIGFKRWASFPFVLDKIRYEISAKADGMFRWAACQLDNIENCLDLEAIEHCLATLPRTLNETYDRILDRIPPERAAKAQRLLQFLLHSERPILLDEAVDIVAVRHGSFDEKDRMPRPSEILGLCPGFLIAYAVKLSKDDFEGDCDLHLSHSSVKEYLLNCRAGFLRLESNISITNVCLGYLTSLAESKMGQLETCFYYGGHYRPNTSSTPFYPFIHYAGNFSFSHARMAMESENSALRTADFLQNKNNLGLLRLLRKTDDFRKLYELSWTLYSAITERGGPLELACFLDLAKVVEILLLRGFSVHGTAQEEEGALYAAVGRRNMAMTELLLNRGAKIDVPRILHRAALERDIDMVRLLLDRGANVNSKYKGSSALYVATEFRHLKMMRLLIERGAEVDAINEGKAFGTALLKAVHLRFRTGVELLLAHGANPNARSREAKPASQIAWKHDAPDVATMQHSEKADNNARVKQKGFYFPSDFTLKGVDTNTWVKEKPAFDATKCLDHWDIAIRNNASGGYDYANTKCLDIAWEVVDDEFARGRWYSHGVLRDRDGRWIDTDDRWL